VEAARSALELTEVFVGVIVIAVIGNAAEHSTAVMMAMKNKIVSASGLPWARACRSRSLSRRRSSFSRILSGRPMGPGVYIARGRAVIAAVHLIFHMVAGKNEGCHLLGKLHAAPAAPMYVYDKSDLKMCQSTIYLQSTESLRLLVLLIESTVSPSALLFPLASRNVYGASRKKSNSQSNPKDEDLACPFAL
jgi:hypothetical protein